MLKLSRLLPQDEKFYALLERLSAQAHASATHLRTFVESTDVSAQAIAGKAITACKSEAKKLLSDVTRELCSTFITPFDREDIQDFAADLYKITKTTEKIRERLSLYGMASRGGDFSRQIDIIVQEAAAMDSVIKALIRSRNSKEIVARVQELRDLEQRGDKILSELLVSLFRDTKEARDLILRKDIYDMLEKVIDRYRDAAGVALQIVLKHS